MQCTVGKLRDDVVAGLQLGGVAHDAAFLQGERVAHVQDAFGGGRLSTLPDQLQPVVRFVGTGVCALFQPLEDTGDPVVLGL